MREIRRMGTSFREYDGKAGARLLRRTALVRAVKKWRRFGIEALQSFSDVSGNLDPLLILLSLG